MLLFVHTPSPPENLERAGAEEVPVIDGFLVAEKGVRFVDGRIERDIEAILCRNTWTILLADWACFRSHNMVSGAVPVR